MIDSVVSVRTDDMHSGMGCISRMKMRTMSLFENGESSGIEPAPVF